MCDFYFYSLRSYSKKINNNNKSTRVPLTALIFSLHFKSFSNFKISVLFLFLFPFAICHRFLSLAKQLLLEMHFMRQLLVIFHFFLPFWHPHMYIAYQKFDLLSSLRGNAQFLISVFIAWHIWRIDGLFR